jgi:hypothetical protein
MGKGLIMFKDRLLVFMGNALAALKVQIPE